VWRIVILASLKRTPIRQKAIIAAHLIGMEYERALFRVYERLLEGVSETGSTNSVNKTCRMFEYLVLTLGAILFICLVILHISFVGTGGCLPQLLIDYAIVHQNSSFSIFQMTKSFKYT
jgi:hypothetical protein